MIYLELLISFIKVGLFSIGGGYAAMPLIQNEAVNIHGWITMNEFTDLMTISEMTPGPIAINAATFVGMRVCGFGGALVASVGCIFPSLFIVTLLFFLYRKFGKMSTLQTVLASLRPAVVALIASAGINILINMMTGENAFSFTDLNYVGIVLFACAFFALRKFRLSPIPVMAACGAVGLIAYSLI